MTLLTTLRPPSNKLGTTLVDDKFDADTLGTVPTGWTVESGTAWQVIAAPAGMSGRSVLGTTDASFDHYLVRTFTRQTDGLVSIGWRVRTSAVITGRCGIMTVYDSSGGYVAQVGPLNGVWVYGNTSGVSGSIGSWAINTIYDVVVHIDMDQKKFKFQVGTTYYDNAGAWWALTTGTTGVDRIKYSVYSPPGGSFYIDEFGVGQVEPTNPPPTTTGTLTTTGDFDGYACGPDRYGRVVLGYENDDANAASIRLERSNDNTNWTDLGGGQQHLVNTGAGRWVTTDRRPHYGVESTTYGGTVYYRVSAFNSGGNSPTSASGALTANIDVAAYETARFAALSTVMGGAAVPSTAAGEAYPTYWLGAMTYAYFKTGTAQYLTDVENQWTYIKTLDAGTHGCVQLADYTDWIYRDHHWRTVLWTAACSRLLRRVGQTALADEMVDQCDTWVAAFNALMSGDPFDPVTLAGFDADNESVTNNQRVWTATTVYAVGDIVTPTARNGRTYRVTVAGTSSGTQPTWPTSDGGSVSLAGVTYVETSKTAPITYSVYDTSAPYNGLVGENLADLNQNGEHAAALAMLCSDPDSALFGAGAPRTAALQVITDISNLLSTFATSTGAIPIGSTYPADNGDEGYDTLYGAYTLEVGALTHKYAAAQCHAQFDEMLVKGLNWLATSYGTEPVTGKHYTGFTGVYATELLMREYPYRHFGVSNPAYEIRYTAATNFPSIELPTADYDANGAATPDVEDHAARSFTSDQFIELLFNRLAGTVASVSTVTGALTVTDPVKALAGVVAAASTVTGTLTVRAGLVGVVAAQSTVTGVAAASKSLTGVVAAASAVTGTVTGAAKLAGVIGGVSTTTGTLTGGAALQGVVAAVSTVTGTLTVLGANALAGVVNSSSTVTGTLLVTKPFAGVVASVSTVTGTLAVTAPLSGTVASTATVTGNVDARAALTGVVAASTSVTGTLAVDKPLAGVVASAATVTGDLTVEAPGENNLRGVVASTSTVTGTVHVIRQLAGVVDGQGAVTGNLTSGVSLTATVAAASTVAGSLTVSHSLAGTVTGSSSITGAAVLYHGLSGTIVATSTVTGELRPAISRWNVDTAPRWLMISGDKWEIEPADRWELVR